MRLPVLAGRTKLRRLLADVDVAAVATLPAHNVFLLEHLTLANVRQKLVGALLVLLFGRADGSEISA
jgi:hypothetical protein